MRSHPLEQLSPRNNTDANAIVQIDTPKSPGVLFVHCVFLTIVWIEQKAPEHQKVRPRILVSGVDSHIRSVADDVMMKNETCSW